MPNTLLPGRLGKKSQKLSQKIAKVRKEENDLVKEIEKELSDKTIREVLEICCKGTPKQQKKAETLKSKYDKGNFRFADYVALDELYAVLGDNSKNKEYDDE